LGHDSCWVGGADGGSVAVVVGRCHRRLDAGTDGEPDGRTVRTTRAPFGVAGQEWFVNWDGGEVTVDVTAGTRRPAPTPPSCAPPKLSAVDGDQRRRRRRRRMLQAIAAVLVPLVAVDFHPSFQLIVTSPPGPSF